MINGKSPTAEERLAIAENIIKLTNENGVHLLPGQENGLRKMALTRVAAIQKITEYARFVVFSILDGYEGAMQDSMDTAIVLECAAYMNAMKERPVPMELMHTSLDSFTNTAQVATPGDLLPGEMDTLDEILNLHVN